MRKTGALLKKYKLNNLEKSIRRTCNLPKNFLFFFLNFSLETKFIEPTKQVPRAVPIQPDERRSPAVRTQ